MKREAEKEVLSIFPDLIEKTRARTIRWEALGPEMANTHVQNMDVTVSGSPVYAGTSVIVTVDREGATEPTTIIIRPTDLGYDNAVSLLRAVHEYD